MSSKALVRSYTKRRRGPRKALPLRVKIPQEVHTAVLVDSDDNTVTCYVLGTHKTKRGALQHALLNMVEWFEHAKFTKMFTPTPEQLEARDAKELEYSEPQKSRLKSLRQSAAWKAFEVYTSDPRARDLETELDKLDSSEKLNGDLELIMSELDSLTDSTHWSVGVTQLLA